MLQARLPPAAAPPHWLLLVHDTTQMLFAVSQAMVPASPQLPSLRHWTHWLVDVLQVWRPPPVVAQFASLVHATQRPVAVSHAGRPAVPAHCALVVQPVTHVLVAGLQTLPPSPQSAVVAQPTHAPAGEQTCLPATPAHWVLLVHATQVLLALQCVPVLPGLGQSPSTRHWTHELVAVSQIGVGPVHIPLSVQPTPVPPELLPLELLPPELLAPELLAPELLPPELLAPELDAPELPPPELAPLELSSPESPPLEPSVDVASPPSPPELLVVESPLSSPDDEPEEPDEESVLSSPASEPLEVPEDPLLLLPLPLPPDDAPPLAPPDVPPLEELPDPDPLSELEPPQATPTAMATAIVTRALDDFMCFISCKSSLEYALGARRALPAQSHDPSLSRLVPRPGRIQAKAPR
jgi:hypothetical protein